MSAPEFLKTLRLPQTVRPTEYDLDLAISLESFTTEGRVAVTLSVAEATKEIVFHAVGLAIAKEDVEVHQNGDVVEAESVEMFPAGEFCRVVLKREIAAGVSELRVAFRGEVTPTLVGLYRSKYTKDGVDKYLATTQFEATDARRAFPCWDEPEFKAVFGITLRVDEELTALSNMPVASEKSNGDGTKSVVFEKTPKMSTYLVAFTVGEFDFVEGFTKTGIKVRVYTPPGHAANGNYALQMATWTLDFYAEYFDIAYPLIKCDMVALKDFAFGAMENWGLITYREIDLLIDEKTSSLTQKMRVAEVVAHELAHQWFGNLVTMKWWNDIWLNEGFATYMAQFASSARFPEWNLWTPFLNNKFFPFLNLDMMSTSHPIDVPVAGADVLEMFDAISYNKGCSVIRMLAEYLGHEAFRDGLRIYLKRFKYQNTVTSDLWTALSEASNQPVAELMNDWTRRMGYPLIRVHKDSAGYKLTQEKMSGAGPSEESAAAEPWFIPMKAVSDAETAVFSVCEKEKDVTVNGSFVNFNSGFSLPGRIIYDDELYRAFHEPIAAHKLCAQDRLGLLNDAYSLGKTGYHKMTVYLDLVKQFANEDDPFVMSFVINTLGTLKGLFVNNETMTDAFTKFVVDTLGPLGERLGWDDKPEDSEATRFLRSIVVGTLARNGHPVFTQKVEELFEAYWAKPEETHIVPELRSAMFATAAKWSKNPEDTYAKLLDIFNRTTLQEERVTVIRALGEFKSKELALKTLEWGVKSGAVRSQDMYFVTAAVCGSNPDLLWTYVNENWEFIKKAIGLSQGIIRSVVSHAVHAMFTDDKLPLVKKFIDEHPVDGLARSYAQIYEELGIKQKWLNSCAADVEAWFKAL